MLPSVHTLIFIEKNLSKLLSACLIISPIVCALDVVTTMKANIINIIILVIIFFLIVFLLSFKIYSSISTSFFIKYTPTLIIPIIIIINEIYITGEPVFTEIIN